MNRALQIANYIIHTASDVNRDVTNLHLQKILYYLQANELVSTEQPLFKESIEKWRLGPVIPEVYHEYKEYGSQPITDIATEIFFNEETMDIDFMEFKEESIPQETRERIRPLIIQLLHQNAFKLVDKTHEHTPWKKKRIEIERGDKGLLYEDEEIRSYFLQHPEMLDEVIGGAH